MATNTLLSKENYLRTSFDGPEPDYVDGELVERSLPNYLHSRVQGRLMDAFKPWDDRRQMFRASEVRLRVAPERFRIVDFSIFTSGGSCKIRFCGPFGNRSLTLTARKVNRINTSLQSRDR